MKIKQGFCKECGKRVRVEKEKTSHLFHLLMTLCTLGLWQIVWAGTMVTGQWRCAYCGSTKINKIR